MVPLADVHPFPRVVPGPENCETNLTFPREEPADPGSGWEPSASVPSAPQAPAPPGYAPAPSAPTGASSWALGFLAFIPFPLVSLLAAAVVMVSMYPSARRTGVAVAAENGRRAANWGLTIITYYVLSAIYMPVASMLTSNAPGFFPVGWPVVGYLVLCLLHLIVVIRGMVKARRGEVFRNALGIPFIRRTA